MSAHRREPQKWSAVGAARYARDARVAAVRYLRDSRLAVEQIEFLVRTGFEVNYRMHGDARRAVAQMLGAAGYLPPYADSSVAAAQMIARDEADRLAVAALYVASPEMADVVAAAAQTLTDDDLDLLDLTDLPSAAGCLVLPEPVVLRRSGGGLTDCRAIAWGVSSLGQPDVVTRRVRTSPGVRVTGYYDMASSLRTRADLAAAERARRDGLPMPPMLLDTIVGQIFRPDAVARSSSHRQRDRLRRRQGMREIAAMVDAAEIARLDVAAPLVGEYAPGGVIDDPDCDFCLRYLYAFWRLCGQKMAASESAPVTHSARVVAQRTGTDPDVRIIRLRTKAREPMGQHRAVEWQHRRVVQMHKVRQWYPSEQHHKIILRGPYVKGPEGKPLLRGDAVRALLR